MGNLRETFVSLITSTRIHKSSINFYYRYYGYIERDFCKTERGECIFMGNVFRGCEMFS